MLRASVPRGRAPHSHGRARAPPRWSHVHPFGGLARGYAAPVADSPLHAHASSPRELSERIAAERAGSAFLLYRDRDGNQVILPLRRDRVTIGRRPSNDVALDWDSEVSRVHAALERAGDDWTLVDDGLSHNGTYVGGDRVTGRRRLRDGDVIGVGGTAIAYCAPDGSSTSMQTVTSVGPRIAELLTPAQRRVLVALCRPFRDETYATPATNQQIADELVVSVDAVKSNLRALFGVFGIDDLPQNQKRASLRSVASS
jgi:pSer/pThr/pTyr-binding forkhead associated (FHA) protein